mgnify:CR=1 FL=1|jgi:hypothetical protein
MIGKFTMNEVRIIINVQHSKIGYAYPRLFIEFQPEEKYINYDLTLGATFRMPKEDWDDWFEDSVDVDAKVICDEYKIDYDHLDGLTKEIIEARKSVLNA